MAIVASAEAGLRAAPRATIVQLRAAELSARELEREAVRLVASSPVPVLISSRCDIALAAGAAGVNLPERDIGIEFARGLMRHGLVGRSVHSIAAAQRAEIESHPSVDPVGVEALSRVAAALRIPVLAIGGVTEERIASVHGAGAEGYAAIRMFR